MTDKKCLNKFYILFRFFIAFFDKQANIHCSIGSISRSVSSHDHNSTNRTIAMGRYKSYFREFDNFFSGKRQDAVKTDQKIYSSYLQFYLRSYLRFLLI